MKKVLIALDYGLSAQTIAKSGYELAKRLQSKVTLLHVVADESYYSNIDALPFVGVYGYDFFNAVESNDSLVLSALSFLENIKNSLNEPTIEIVATQGDFAEVILETAKSRMADLIVLGSHSQNWLEKTIMGSVTESVLAETEIPLYIIPIKYKKEQ